MIVSIMQTMFSINVLNTQVVDNFHVLLVLEFHDFRADSLGVIGFTCSLSVFTCFLCRSDT